MIKTIFFNDQPLATVDDNGNIKVFAEFQEVTIQ